MILCGIKRSAFSYVRIDKQSQVAQTTMVLREVPVMYRAAVLAEV